MGCGKSSVGRELSKLLCCPFMDLDDVIEERSGRRIPEIFATDGEAGFRRMEADALEFVFNTHEIRQSAPLAPSHFVGPLPILLPQAARRKGPPDHFPGRSRPYPGVGKCQFRTNALSPDTEWQNSGHVHLANTSHDQADTPDPSVPVSAVVALGGGTVMTKECAEMVHEKTLCIYLRASIETLVSHLEGESSGRPMLQGAPLDVISSEDDLQSEGEADGRPMLSGGCHSERPEGDEESALRSRIADLMARRAPAYEKTSHIIIDTDGKSISDISMEISDYFHALFDRISGEADIL